MLLTTQYLDEADQLASHIVIIDHGKAVAAGSPAELKRRTGGRVIEVHTRFRDDLSVVAGALERLDRPAQVDEATRKVSLGVDGAANWLAAALQAMEASGANVEDISLRQPSLDEVFLTLTGATN